MGKAGGIIGLIGGVFAVIAAMVTLVIGGVGAAFQAKNAGTVVDFGWYGLAAAFLVIVFASITIAKPGIGSFGLLILSAVGAVVGGTFVAICLGLAWVGGVLAAMGVKPNPQGRKTLWQWSGLPLGIMAGIAIAVVAAAPDKYESGQKISTQVGSATALASPMKIDTGSSYLGQHPTELFKNAELQKRFRTLLGENYEPFLASLSVANQLEEKGAYYFGAGCMPHACTQFESAFTIDKNTGLIAAGMLVDSKQIVTFGPTSIHDLPQPLYAWYKEHGGQD